MIDSESIIPLYEQVSNKIHEKILRGELKPGARIGSINELIKEYHVSRVTAVNAIEDMVKKGFAVSRQGKGTFVKEAYIGDELLSLRSFNEISVEGHSSIIRFERTELPEKLQSTFDGETERLLIHRLQFFKDSPIGLIEITLPWSVAEKVNPAKDVTIGDRVWIGYGTTILKGSVIESDSIIGTQSVVTGKHIPKGSIAAGNPIRVLKQGFHWGREKIR